jgi:hypothetical protein
MVRMGEEVKNCPKLRDDTYGLPQGISIEGSTQSIVTVFPPDTQWVGEAV